MNWINLKNKPVAMLIAVTIFGAGLSAAPVVPEVWTTLFKKNLISGLLALNDIRVRMQTNKKNLVDTYENFPASVTCDENSKKYRTADGSCNDLKQSEMGKANARFGRNVPLDRAFGETEPELMDPNPREISNRLLARDKF